MRGKRRQTKQRNKRLIRIIAIAIGVVLLLFVTAGIVAQSVITREFLIEEIESSISSEVEMGSANVSIFSFPARITLNDVRLAPRAEDAATNDASLLIERVDLRVSLWALLVKEINVKSITVSGADLTTTYRDDGSTSIEELFDKPEEDGAGDADDGSGSSTPGERSGFNAFEQKDFVAALGRLTIEHSRAKILLEDMEVKLLCTDLNLELSEMRVDPNRLNETDTARLTFSVDIRSDSIDGWKNGEFFLTGEASARLFNPQTGETEPDIEGDISISDRSWLNTRIPFITKAWAQLEILEKIGIKISKLPERATFGRSEAIAAHYHLGVVTVRKPLSIWVGDWELAALDGSWLDTGTDDHEIQGELLASKSASGTFIAMIEKGVDYLPKEASRAVVENVTGKLYRDDRLLVPIESTGDFSDPKIRPSGPIPDLAESAKKAAKKLLKDKLNGLLNRD